MTAITDLILLCANDCMLQSVCKLSHSIQLFFCRVLQVLCAAFLFVNGCACAEDGVGWGQNSGRARSASLWPGGAAAQQEARRPARGAYPGRTEGGGDAYTRFLDVLHIIAC